MVEDGRSIIKNGTFIDKVDGSIYKGATFMNGYATFTNEDATFVNEYGILHIIFAKKRNIFPT